jgi:protein phosphatase
MGASLFNKLMDGADKLLGDTRRITSPPGQPGEAARAQPESLAGGYLYPNAVYQRTALVGPHTAYFVAQNEQGHSFLIRQVSTSLCDVNVIRTLVSLSAETPCAQRMIDLVCTADGRTYLVLAHPTERWFFLSDPHDPFPPERAIEWGLQIGQALEALHRHGFALGPKQQGGLEKVLIDGNTAKLADLSGCIQLPTDETQKRQVILDDIFFLACVLYSAARGHKLTKELSSLKLDGLPRPLRVAISSGSRHSYVSVQEMLANLAGRNLPPLRLVSGRATHPGRARDHNEDQFFIYEISKGRSDQPLPALYMVADGMGGHEAGEVASDTISSALKAWLDEFSSRKSGRATQKLGEMPEEAIKTALREANAAVLRQAQARKNNMGATVTAALVVGEQAFVANVGDSRTYLFRRGKLQQITKDHSLVYSLAAASQITWDEIYTHPQRNQIYRSLGEKPNVEVDVFTVNLEPGDMLLLCSDGVWEMVRDPQISDILGKTKNPQEACDRLIDAANRGGGEDNITAIVVKVE